jgi:hypothetical protein
VTLVGVIGGGAVLALFPAGTDLFGAYGLGLCAGFFAYFIVLVLLVWSSRNFTRDWFLDGRRKVLPADFYIPEIDGKPVNPPMSAGTAGQRDTTIG